MDTFTLIVTVGMVLLFLWILALGVWHPKSGAEILDWRPTRSPEVEAQNDIDDVEQMIAAQNRLREKRGQSARTQADVEAQVEEQRRELEEYADAYWADQRRRRVDEANADGGITLYVKTECSNCQRVQRILGERGVEFESIDFHRTPITAEQIAELLAKARIGPRAALRMKEDAAKALVERDAPDAEIVAAMAADPGLLQRPLVERGERAVLARPAERALELL